MKTTEFMYLIQYVEQALNWQLWEKSADNLLAASKKLEPNIKKYWSEWREILTEERKNLKVRDIDPKIIPRRYFQDIYSMLVAYAIENLCKASLILKNKKQYEQEILQKGILPADLKTPRHDLAKLVKKLNLYINPYEKNLLLRISRNSHWQGRYPVPVKAEDLNPVVKDEGNAHFVAFLAPEDIPKLKLLIIRIKKNIKDSSS